MHILSLVDWISIEGELKQAPDSISGVGNHLLTLGHLQIIRSSKNGLFNMDLYSGCYQLLFIRNTMPSCLRRERQVF